MGKIAKINPKRRPEPGHCSRLVGQAVSLFLLQTNIVIYNISNKIYIIDLLVNQIYVLGGYNSSRRLYMLIK